MTLPRLSHEEIVNSIEAAAYLLAGHGMGTTAALLERIAKQMREDGEPHRVARDVTKTKETT